MKKLAKWVWFLAAVMFTSAALAQPYAEPRTRAIFEQPELDQMLAPIALYPDSLLSQILMAATYPRELAEAASWSRAYPGLRGEQAVRAVERENWDPSVISLVAFPQVLAMMDERRGWTERLGAAFLDQPDEVMGTVQDLRRRADAAGSLRSSEEIVVQRQGNDYLIDPPSPEVVYVPYYDPRVAYGNWWWPDYQPVYWNPWPGYGYRAGYGGFGWGYGISLGSGFFYGAFDWPRRYLRYSSQRPWYYHGRDYRSGTRWTHGRDYRRDLRAPDRRDARTTERRASTRASATTTQGFFPPRTVTSVPQRVESRLPQQAAPQNPSVRTVTPRYGTDAQRSESRSSRQTLQPQAQPQVQVPLPQTRSGPTRQGTPAPERAEQPRSAPAPSRSPVARPAERSAPVERSDSVERSSPAERSGGSRGGGRDR